MSEQIKKRNPNFSTDEKSLLLHCVYDEREVVENKKTDVSTWKDKESAWRRIEKNFNSQCGFSCFRSSHSLKRFYSNYKAETRKDAAQEKFVIVQTGGGKPFKPTDPNFDLAIAIMNPKTVHGLKNEFDGDNEVDKQDENKDKREERRKKATLGKSSCAGNQGRETKTKATKKFKQPDGNKGGCLGSDKDVDNRTNIKSNQVLEFVKKDELKKIIIKVLKEEGIEHLSGVITDIYHSEINQAAIQEAHKLLETTSQCNRREIHVSTQEKINTLMVDIRLYEKGLKVFPLDVQSQMLKYLMTTLGNDICTELTIYLANECNLEIKSGSTLNIDQRNKIANECDPEYKTKLIKVNKALSKTFEEFVLTAEEVLKACGMVIKKVDKKKDRGLVIQHKEKLFQQLNETDDHAITLHLTSLIIFTTVTGFILHASGRFVAQILAFIRPSMSSEQSNLVTQFYDLVLKVLQLDIESGEYKTVYHQLKSIQPDIKALAKSYKKPGETKSY